MAACGFCKVAEPKLRCEDCFGGLIFCVKCMIDMHVSNPLHCIEVHIILPRLLATLYLSTSFQHWNGTFFESTALKNIGLRIQLGHQIGKACSNPVTADGDNFVVVDTNGIHKVGLDYCDCETAQHQTTQLLRARWYPATPITPNTAATFNVLEHFHLLTFESKASVFEFLHALMRQTNNIYITDVPVSPSFK